MQFYCVERSRSGILIITLVLLVAKGIVKLAKIYEHTRVGDV